MVFTGRLAERRAAKLLQRRKQDYDDFAEDPNYVMYRGSDGTPVPEEGQHMVAQTVLELLEPFPAATLLDVGCGHGEMTKQFVPHFAAVSGIDLSPGMIELARTALPDVDLHVGPAHDLPFDDENFDRAVSYGVFMLFPDYAYARKALREILRVLRPEGILVIGDVADVTLKHLSYEGKQLRARPLGWQFAESARREMSNLLFGERPYGFYRLPFFEQEAARAGNGFRVVRQPAEVERSEWRVNVVISKQGRDFTG